jgi:hypothetical protein
LKRRSAKWLLTDARWFSIGEFGSIAGLQRFSKSILHLWVADSEHCATDSVATMPRGCRSGGAAVPEALQPLP